jgi:beta-glucosidase
MLKYRHTTPTKDIFMTTLPYRNPALPVNERVADLLSRMTVEEKTGQLLQPEGGWQSYTRNGDDISITPEWEKKIVEQGIGALYGLHRADPWTQVTLEKGLHPRHSAKASNLAQRLAVEKTRLGIPMLLSEEAPHGHQAIGATIFPCGISLGQSWDPALIRKVGAIIGSEVASRGGHLSYGPICDLALEPRWSRCEESFGEDPFHAGILAAAMVHGVQDDGGMGRVRCTLKHYIGYGATQGGRNGSAAHFGVRELQSVYLPPFAAAINAGAGSLMASYNAVDGEPVIGSYRLMTEVLRDELGFKGIVVGDGHAAENLYNTYRATPTGPAAIAEAVRCGTDLSLWDIAAEYLTEEVTSGRMEMIDLDRAVGRILEMKFELGLFENPYIDEKLPEKIVCSPSHREVALEAARAGLVLLKNEKSILPLSANIKKLAVIGPNADAMYNQLGDYTAPQPEGIASTPLSALREMLPDCEITNARGCGINTPDTSGIFAAVAAAQTAGICIAVIGGSSARDFNACFSVTGAVDITNAGDFEMDSGEGADRCTLGLRGAQQEMLEAIHAAGVPIIAILIKGRPMALPWLKEHAAAIIDAGYPGMEGGTAIAEAIIGAYNPGGRLAMTAPTEVGTLPVYYHHQEVGWNSYLESDGKALWRFGDGMSYTQFDYLDCKLCGSDKIAPKNGITLSITVKNTGELAGDEVIQVYVRQEQAPFSRPAYTLQAFTRVNLQAGETKTVELTLNPEAFALPDRTGKLTWYPGEFKIMVGGSQDAKKELMVVSE